MISVSAVTPSKVKVTGPAAALAEWRQSLRCRVPGYEYTPQYQAGHWDGYVYPGRRFAAGADGNRVLTMGRGLLPYLFEHFPDAHYPDPIGVCTLNLDGLPEKLYDYQVESLEMIEERQWGRLALATNAGKGAIIALAAGRAAASGWRTLILADEIAVFQALEEEIAEWVDVNVGTVEAGRKTLPKEMVVLAMVPTLTRRLKAKEEETDAQASKRQAWEAWAADFDVLFLDEADRATSDSWLRIVDAVENSYIRVGFSGSFPYEWNVEEQALAEMMGPVLMRIKNEELIDRGISAETTVELYKYRADSLDQISGLYDLSGPEKRLAVYDAAVVYNHDRHLLIKSMLHPTEPNAIIVNRIAHGEELEIVLPDARYLNGEDPPEVRSAVLEEFKRGAFQNLIVTKILDRGTNHLGKTVGLIFASGEGSKRQTLQRIGRGLRRTDGKQFLFLRDIMDSGHKYLNTASRKRLRLYNLENFDIKIIDA